MIFLPYFISWVIVGVMAFNIFSSDYGILNRLIVALGGEKFPFYTTPQVWPFIILFFNIWKGVGYGSVMYLAAIMGVDTSIYEAAAIDGAGIFRTFFTIILPQLKPITVTRLIMIAVGAWNSYAMPSYLLTDTSKATVILTVRKAFYTAYGAVQNVPLACAMCAVALLPVILLYVLLQRYIIEGQLDSVSK